MLAHFCLRRFRMLLLLRSSVLSRSRCYRCRNHPSRHGRIPRFHHDDTCHLPLRHHPLSKTKEKESRKQANVLRSPVNITYDIDDLNILLRPPVFSKEHGTASLIGPISQNNTFAIVHHSFHDRYHYIPRLAATPGICLPVTLLYD